MRQQSAKAQRKAAEIAARQHGVVSYEQLLWAGFTPSTRRGHEVVRFTDREVAAEEEAVAASVLRQPRRPPDGRGQG